eukprot:1160440-Pelagomonas_calceolata.AAC.1
MGRLSKERAFPGEKEARQGIVSTIVRAELAAIAAVILQSRSHIATVVTPPNQEANTLSRAPSSACPRPYP